MDPNRALTPVDGQAGFRMRQGQRFIGSYYRVGVTKLAGINFALQLPVGDWNVRIAVSAELSRMLIYEDAVLTANGTEIKLFNTFRRFELKSNSPGAGRTDARLFVDPVASSPGLNLYDFNISDHPARSNIEPSETPLILSGGINYLIAVQPEPQLTTVGLLMDLWTER